MVMGGGRRGREAWVAKGHEGTCGYDPFVIMTAVTVSWVHLTVHIKMCSLLCVSCNSAKPYEAQCDLISKSLVAAVSRGWGVGVSVEAGSHQEAGSAIWVRGAGGSGDGGSGKECAV